MRPTEGCAGRPLGAAGFPQGTNSKLIVAVRGEDGKQAALPRLGEILAAMPKNTGAAGSAGPGRGNAVPIANRVSDAPTLADLGIDKKVSK
mgnify:CR=1 FL=1